MSSWSDMTVKQKACLERLLFLTTVQSSAISILTAHDVGQTIKPPNTRSLTHAAQDAMKSTTTMPAAEKVLPCLQVVFGVGMYGCWHCRHTCSQCNESMALHRISCTLCSKQYMPRVSWLDGACDLMSTTL